MKRAEEGGCNGARERYREERGRKGDREGNFKGCTMMRTLANTQYTLLKTTHNAALALETLVLGMKNSEHVYYLNSVLGPMYDASWCIV